MFYRSAYKNNSTTARLFRYAVHRAFPMKTSYKTASGRMYGKTQRSIRSGTFRGFYFRNGRNAPK